MCAILGVFSYAARGNEEEATLRRMRDVMVHRGPDDAGLYMSPDRRVWLGHRRLSIVDLSSAGHQPMTNEDESVWITFNGEIYNHQTLRGDMIEKGHRFASKTDTEAIVHLYEEEGAECVTRLDGMFAFGIWDARRRQLLLARDRLGKKPLYYTIVSGRLLFASEIKALVQHPLVKRDLDLEALNLYLTFSNTPAPHTLFVGIKKLPAAHTLLCDEHGSITIRRYWSPLSSDAWSRRIVEAEGVEEIRRLIQRSVQKRLMSDVPIGAFLSGGVDSSTNVALMSRLTSQPIRTFSIGFSGFGEAENFHDLPYARQVAREFECVHTEIMIDAEECREYVPQLVYQQDEPIADPACLPMYFVSRAAKEHGVTVVLVGEGSDEVFGGYPDMRSVISAHRKRWNRVRLLPRSLRAGLYRASSLLGSPPGRVDVLRRAAEEEPLYWGLDVVFWDVEKRDLLTHGACRYMGPSAARTVQGYYDEINRIHPTADLLQQMSYVELSNRLPELLLMRVDKISMAHSLEARAPFLDADLVSYAIALPMGLKINGSRTKHVLKQAVRPYLPRGVIERAKQGFRVPLPAWLCTDLRSWAHHSIFSSGLRRRAVFNYEYIQKLWNRHQSGKFDHSFDLWSMINLSSWYEHWIDGKSV